jgi:hypothetical protein
MLLTITTTCRPATDLGFLLHKNPARVHEFELSFGRAHVFYPEASDTRCTVWRCASPRWGRGAEPLRRPRAAAPSPRMRLRRLGPGKRTRRFPAMSRHSRRIPTRPAALERARRALLSYHIVPRLRASRCDTFCRGGALLFLPDVHSHETAYDPRKKIATTKAETHATDAPPPIASRVPAVA